MSYLELNNALLDAGAIQSPAGVHGYICALVVLNDTPDDESSLARTADATSSVKTADVAEDTEACASAHDSVAYLLESARLYAGIDLSKEFGSDSKALTGPECPELTQLIHRTVEGLSDTSLNHYPLIPEDDCDIYSRLMAIAEWSRGFLEGFAQRCERTEAVSQTRADFVKELAQVAALDVEEHYDESGENEAERMLSELVEHLKLSLYSLMLDRHNPSKVTKASTKDDPNTPTIQ